MDKALENSEENGKFVPIKFKVNLEILAISKIYWGFSISEFCAIQ